MSQKSLFLRNDFVLDLHLRAISVWFKEKDKGKVSYKLSHKAWIVIALLEYLTCICKLIINKHE